jgi:hypothetical protein
MKKAAIGCLAWLLAACAQYQVPLQDTPPHVCLRSAGELYPDMHVEEQVIFESPGGSFVGRGIIDKQDDELRVVVLGRFDITMVNLCFKGNDLTVDYVSADFPVIDLRYFVRDIQWMFFAACQNNRFSAATRSCRVCERTCTETYSRNSILPDYRLIRGGGDDIRITYVYAETGPERGMILEIHLENRAMEYRISAIILACDLFR